MNLPELAEWLQSRLQLPLPGATAHQPMRAAPVGTVLPKFEHKSNPKPGSVLILLYPEADSICFPLIKRPAYVGAHGGQVSLPGGKAEPEETAVQTALREAYEEVGVSPSTVHVLGVLSDFFVVPSNFLVTPVVGFVDEKPLFVADPIEVAHVLTGNLWEIVRPDAVKEKEILAAGRYRMWAPHFDVDGEVVWGATAMMLNELRVILQEYQQM